MEPKASGTWVRKAWWKRIKICYDILSSSSRCEDRVISAETVVLPSALHGCCLADWAVHQLDMMLICWAEVISSLLFSSHRRSDHITEDKMTRLLGIPHEYVDVKLKVLLAIIKWWIYLAKSSNEMIVYLARVEWHVDQRATGLKKKVVRMMQDTFDVNSWDEMVKKSHEGISHDLIKDAATKLNMRCGKDIKGMMVWFQRTHQMQRTADAHAREVDDGLPMVVHYGVQNQMMMQLRLVQHSLQIYQGTKVGPEDVK